MGVHSLKIEGLPNLSTIAHAPRRFIVKLSMRRCGQTVRYQPAGNSGRSGARGYTEGFLRRHTHDDYQNYDTVIQSLTASSLLVSLPVSAGRPRGGSGEK